MTKEQKINAIIDIQKGIPKKYALNLKVYKILYRNKGEQHYQTETGEIISEEEKQKYLHDSFIFENVSNKFKFGQGELNKS